MTGNLSEGNMLNLKKSAGLVLAFIVFFIPLVIPIPSLAFPARLTMGIFLSAAVLWMLEPIPIYSTSMLVIFLETLLLSGQGILFNLPMQGVEPMAAEETGTWRVAPDTIADTSVFLLEDGHLDKAVPVEVVGEEDGLVVIRAADLEKGSMIASDASDWRVQYKPLSYKNFFNALAHPIVILFLAGFLLAGASVKFDLDKTLTRVFLQPFGTRPAMIIMGLMLATATLSAFMSNTATTAMMVTVIMPILSQLKIDDPLRKSVALAIPVGANIGGIATPIGTPPNAVVLAALQSSGIFIPFGTWMLLALPFALFLLFAAWILLIKLFPAQQKNVTLVLKGKLNKSPKAIMLYIFFGAAAIMWMTEQQHGISNSIVAMMAIVALTVTGVVTKEDIRGVPWEVLWLFSGGIALGEAVSQTGLAAWFVNSINLETLGYMGLLALIGVVGQFPFAHCYGHASGSTRHQSAVFRRGQRRGCLRCIDGHGRDRFQPGYEPADFNPA
jgi:sodium-dependent dicarboxylate transporter 2/3/5